MKWLVLILVLGLALQGAGQSIDTIAIKQRIVKEIAEYCDDVRCNYISYIAQKKEIKYTQADSLGNISSLTELKEYYKSNCRALKYYSFIQICKKDENVALQLLEGSINDTTHMTYSCADLFGSSQLFNNLIHGEFGGFLSDKYYMKGTVPPKSIEKRLKKLNNIVHRYNKEFLKQTGHLK